MKCEHGVRHALCQHEHASHRGEVGGQCAHSYYGFHKARPLHLTQRLYCTGHDPQSDAHLDERSAKAKQRRNAYHEVTGLHGGNEQPHVPCQHVHTAHCRRKGREVLEKVLALDGIRDGHESRAQSLRRRGQSQQRRRRTPQRRGFQQLRPESTHRRVKGLHFRFQQLCRRHQFSDQHHRSAQHPDEPLRVDAAHDEHGPRQHQQGRADAREDLGALLFLPCFQSPRQRVEASRNAVQHLRQGRCQHLPQAVHDLGELCDGVGEQSHVQKTQESVNIRPADGVESVFQCLEKGLHRFVDSGRRALHVPGSALELLGKGAHRSPHDGGQACQHVLIPIQVLALPGDKVGHSADCFVRTFLQVAQRSIHDTGHGQCTGAQSFQNAQQGVDPLAHSVRQAVGPF